MQRRIFVTATAGAVLAAAALPAAAAGENLAERFAAALSAHDMVAFAALFAEDYRNHQTNAAAPPGPATGTSMKQLSVAFFAARLAAMPDLIVTTEVVVTTADRLAASFVYTGTQTGPYLGFAPSGKKLSFTSCDIFAVRDGLLAEHWGMGDIAGILAQLRG